MIKGINTLSWVAILCGMLFSLFQLGLFQKLEELLIINAQQSLSAVGVLVNIMKWILHRW